MLLQEEIVDQSLVSDVPSEVVESELENVNEVIIDDKLLQTNDLIKGLHSLGMHPVHLAHCYLGCNINNLGISNIDSIGTYKNLMYLDVSENSIETLKILENIPMLVQLNARKNQLIECLDFSPPHCTKENAWSSGNTAIGSMLTLANLSSNKISNMDNICKHPFLECLLLSSNKISRTVGLESLKFLSVLDLSFNNIKVIEGLDGLLIQELNLEGNQLLTLNGFEKLDRLTTLNTAGNNIKSLSALSQCRELKNVDIRNNKIDHIRQVEFLIEIPWLDILILTGNECCSKSQYRARVIYRLPNLKKLDRTLVSSEEKIRSLNLYNAEGGDLAMREEIFKKCLPLDNFEMLYQADFWDDETPLTTQFLQSEIIDTEVNNESLEGVQDFAKSSIDNMMDGLKIN
jgi:hypothetical protein